MIVNKSIFPTMLSLIFLMGCYSSFRPMHECPKYAIHLKTNYETESQLSFVQDYIFDPQKVQICQPGITGRKVTSLPEWEKRNKGYAIRALRGDTIVYNLNLGGFDDHLPELYSITKPMVCAILGIAIDEGFIKSEQQSITDYLPELKGLQSNGFTYDSIRLVHLMRHTAGFGQNATIDHLKNYLQKDMRSKMLNPKKLRIQYKPGETFVYGAANYQLLIIILERALQNIHPELTVGEYFAEKIAIPLGWRSFYWRTERVANGIELGFTGIMCYPDDLLKFGALYLRNGRWEGKQLISEEWIKKSLKPVNGPRSDYGFGWQLDPATETFYVVGFRGQIISCNQKYQTVIVRLANGATLSPADFRAVVLRYLPPQLYY